MNQTSDLPVGTLPISVIIPTFSEEKLLPGLLESIAKQAFRPQEVIVADAFSPDHTREIALSYGATVVDGGRIAVGRNNGAKVAQGAWLLFMDADTVLDSPLTLVEAYVECMKKNVDIASAKYDIIPEEPSKFGKAVGNVVWFMRNTIGTVQNITQQANFEGGAFILVKRELFDRIGGFKEQVALAEDIVFYQDAIKLGAKYRNVKAKVQTSVRRFDTPQKFFRATRYALTQTVLVGLGVYFGARVLKRISHLYGPLGGGKGKMPVEEEE